MQYPSNNFDFCSNQSTNQLNLITEEENLFSDFEDDLSVIVEHILNQFHDINYDEYEKEQLCLKLELIIQNQAKIIYQSKISPQFQNTMLPISSPILYNSYSSSIFPFYQNFFLPYNYYNLNPVEPLLQIEINDKSSTEYIKKRAKQGDITSMIQYGIMLREGYRVKNNELKSIRYFEKAIHKGSAQAMAEYAYTLLDNQWIK